MSSKAIATVQKMLESLPEEAQERVVEHLREYILDLQDELEWDALFELTQECHGPCLLFHLSARSAAVVWRTDYYLTTPRHSCRSQSP